MFQDIVSCVVLNNICIHYGLAYDVSRNLMGCQWGVGDAETSVVNNCRQNSTVFKKRIRYIYFSRKMSNWILAIA